jgi:hypothetical protein
MASKGVRFEPLFLFFCNLPNLEIKLKTNPNLPHTFQFLSVIYN